MARGRDTVVDKNLCHLTDIVTFWSVFENPSTSNVRQEVKSTVFVRSEEGWGKF